ncbi:MAG: hypothetical protein ACLTME_07465 [Clostridia bacterium]|nr:putative uncharacterized protein [Clostridium sp. CAG:921]
MNNKVAVKSGYYFEIFNKEEIPTTLAKTKQKVKINNIQYDLYQGMSLDDERKIDDMFGDRMGYSIDDYIVEKPKCKLVGEDGNIYNLMGIASRALKKNGLEEEAKEMFNKITTEAKSYNEALCIIMDYVDVTGEEISEDEEY